MRKVGFERQGNATYLVYELGPEDAVDSMSLGMLMNNRIPGFAPTVFTQMDNIKQVKCNVTARVPADQYLLGMVNKKRLLGVFRGIVQAYLSAEDYMIDVNSIQLELSSIFSDVATGETVMVCIPVAAESTAGPDLRSFLKNILFSAQYDERENRDYVAQIMSYLNGSPAFSIHEFKELLDYVSLTPAAPVQPVKPEVMAPEQYHYSHTVGGSGGPVPVNQPGPETAPPPEPSAEEIQEEDSDEDKISLFYLLQHYNKENAAMYKQQKEKKKSAKEGKKEAKKADKDGKKGGKKEPESKQPAVRNFAVPGQETPAGSVQSVVKEEPEQKKPQKEVRPEQPKPRQTKVQPGTQQGVVQSGTQQGGVQQAGPYQGGVQQAGPYQGGVQQAGPYQGGVQQAGPYQGGVQQAGPYQGGVQQAGPYQGGVQQAGPYQGGVQQTGPYQGGVQQAGPYQGSVQQAGPYQGGVQQAGPYQGGVQQAGPYQGGVQQAGPYQGGVQQAGPYQGGVQQAGPYQGGVQQAGPVQGSVQQGPDSAKKDETLYFPTDTGDETIFMGQEAKQCRLTPQLIRKRSGEKILICKPVFRLGRDKDFNDYAILENRYVGHGHCHILCRNGEYFVVDDNSKNRTLVNGTPIVPGEEVKIKHGDVICIADEEFDFKLF